MKKLNFIVVVCVGLVVAEVCTADIVVPDWNGDAGTTSVLYSFPSNVTPFLPDAEVNSYGVVQSQIELGLDSLGYGTPGDPFALTRNDGTGTWNIDVGGYMEFVVPFAEGLENAYTLELVIDVIGYLGVTDLPEISVSGTEIESGTYQFLEELDPGPGGSWMHQVWTGTVAIANSSQVTVDLSADPSLGSVIDRVSIYSRMIPEPAAITFVLMTSVMALAIKRRLS